MPPVGMAGGNLDAEISTGINCSVAKEDASFSPFSHEVVILAGSKYEEEAFSREAGVCLGLVLGDSTSMSDGAIFFL